MAWYYLKTDSGNSHCSQGQGAASSEDCCTGGDVCAPLKSKTTHAAFYCNGKLTESYLDSLSGTMYAPSTANHGADGSMSSAGDSHVRTSAQQGRESESQGSVADYGAKWHGLSMRFDPHTFSLKTHHSLFQEDLDWSCVIFPRWGMMLDGELWERITSEPRTNGIGSGSLPTPQASDGTMKIKFKVPAIENHITSEKHALPLIYKLLQMGVGLESIPETYEWIMLWPKGWTDLKPLATDKYQQWLHSHGRY
jgi:hypothetical protein